MQLFAVCLAREGHPPRDVGGALGRAARATPQLDLDGLSRGRSSSGRVTFARLAHGAEHAAPRRYAAERRAELVLFDGFPLDGEGAFAAHDAAELLERWDGLPGRLDGIFSALRIDLARDTVECLTDPLGLARVFVHAGEDCVLLSNSAEAIRLHAGLSTPDPVGVSTLLTLGYVASERTLLDGVVPLDGGALHAVTPAGTTARPYFTPSGALGARPPHDVLADRVLVCARAAAESGAPLRSGLTSGRDTRVLLALLRAAGAAEAVDFYTSGGPEDLDVRRAAELAERFGLRHRLTVPVAPTGAAWAEQTTQFLVRTDGLGNLELISDWVDHELPLDRVALEFWGGGGEVGRTNKHVLGPLAAMLPGLRGSHPAAVRVLTRGVGDATGALRPAAVAQARGHLRSFAGRFAAEGWPADTLQEAFYAFEFFPARPGMGVRRASGTTDLFSPFATRAFVEHAFAVSPGERFLEGPHHDLIMRLAPEVDALPYQMPWKPQRLEMGLALALDEARRRAGRRLRGTSPPPEAVGQPFYIAWFEAGVEQHRDVVLSSSASPLWDFVDRARYEALVRCAPSEREPHVKALCRVLSAFWYLHAGRSGDAAILQA